uniref:Uncharacterized protein n=1 Tax=Plectus sambesii TaxID=2011161 RepID=A0A914WEH0_9BILA
MTECICNGSHNVAAAHTESDSSASHDYEDWIIWSVGFAMVSATAFAAYGGIMLMPLLGKKSYNRTLTFLSGLGVGSLSGSTMFIMLPEAFHISELSSGDYAYKSWMTLCGIYMLFIIDKLLHFLFEVRKVKRQRSAVQTIVENLHPTVRIPTKEKTKEEEEEENATVANMVLFANLLINFVDGIAMGAAFGDGLLRGLSVSIAILLQQFPQEIADLAVLINAGVGVRRAFLLNLIPGVLSYLGYVIGIVLRRQNARYSDVIFAVAAGMYLYICLATLIPEMSAKIVEEFKHSRKEGILITLLQNAGIVVGLLIMFEMSLFDQDIHINA